MKPIVLDRVLPALERVGQALAVIAMVMIICLIAVMIFEVVARRVFNAPTIWAIDITYMTNGTLFLIGGAYTLQRNAHVRIDFLSSRLPVRVQHAVNLLFYLCIFIPLMWLTSHATVLKAHKAFVRGTLENMSTWEPVVWPFLTGIAIGVVGLTLQVLVESVRHAVGIADPGAVRAPSERAVSTPA